MTDQTDIAQTVIINLTLNGPRDQINRALQWLPECRVVHEGSWSEVTIGAGALSIAALCGHIGRNFHTIIFVGMSMKIQRDGQVWELSLNAQNPWDLHVYKILDAGAG